MVTVICESRGQREIPVAFMYLYNRETLFAWNWKRFRVSLSGV